MLGYRMKAFPLYDRNGYVSSLSSVCCFCFRMPAGQWLGWHHHSGEEKVLEGVDNSGKVDLDDDAWVPTELMQEPSVLEVTQVKGSFCEIDVHFSVPLDPDGVYGILTDPNNHRVFKNIKVFSSLPTEV